MRWATTRSSVIFRLRDPDDDDAWRAFDRLYGEVMVRYACGRGLSLDDAQDVRQIVLMSLVRSMPRFELRRDRGRFRSYLGRVVGNAIHRFRSRSARRNEVPTDDLELFDRGSASAPDESTWEREWSQHHLRRALEALTRSARPRSMEVFAQLLDGQSPECVARSAGMTIDAVYKLQQRFRDRLRTLVKEQIEDEWRSIEKLPEREVS